MRQAALARREHRPADAHRDYAAAVALCRQTGEQRSLVHALKGLGQIEQDRGRGDAAQPMYEEAVAICRTLEDPLLLAHSVRHLGDIHLDAGRLANAEPCLVEALEIYRAQNGTQPGDLANAIRPMAILTESTGRIEESRTLWEEARELYARGGIQAGVDECAAHLTRLRGR